MEFVVGYIKDFTLFQWLELNWKEGLPQVQCTDESHWDEVDKAAGLFWDQAAGYLIKRHGDKAAGESTVD